MVQSIEFVVETLESEMFTVLLEMYYSFAEVEIFDLF